MGACINELWDLFDNYFIEHTIRVFPRCEKMIIDSLVISTGILRTPMAKQRERKVEIRNRPSLAKNSIH